MLSILLAVIVGIGTGFATAVGLNNLQLGFAAGDAIGVITYALLRIAEAIERR